jgi:probable addiction module antidote protein
MAVIKRPKAKILKKQRKYYRSLTMATFNKFEASNYIKSEEQALDYLKTMFDENGTQGFLQALGDIAKAKGMGNISKETGLGRESLYKSLSKNGNPSFNNVVKTLKALDIDFSFTTRSEKNDDYCLGRAVEKRLKDNNKSISVSLGDL